MSGSVFWENFLFPGIFKSLEISKGKWVAHSDILAFFPMLLKKNNGGASSSCSQKLLGCGMLLLSFVWWDVGVQNRSFLLFFSIPRQKH